MKINILQAKSLVGIINGTETIVYFEDFKYVSQTGQCQYNCKDPLVRGLLVLHSTYNYDIIVSKVQFGQYEMFKQFIIVFKCFDKEIWNLGEASKNKQAGTCIGCEGLLNISCDLSLQIF